MTLKKTLLRVTEKNIHHEVDSGQAVVENPDKMSKRIKSKGPRVEITRWKVGNDSDAFQAVDPVETWEEPEIAECYDVEEERNA